MTTQRFISCCHDSDTTLQQPKVAMDRSGHGGVDMKRRSTGASDDVEQLRSQLSSAVTARQHARLQKVILRLDDLSSTQPIPQYVQDQVRGARRLLLLLGLLDNLDARVQQLEFDHHTRFAEMQQGHVLVTLRKSPEESFGIIFAKSKLVDPATGNEFKSLICKRMKYQGRPYNVAGCINGDILLEVNGQPVTSSKQLNELIGDLNAVVLKINRSPPQAMSIAELEVALSELNQVLADIDDLPVAPPGAADNMTAMEGDLLGYARGVVHRTKKELAVLVLLDVTIDEIARGSNKPGHSARETDLPDLWEAACKLRLDKQLHPADNEVAKLMKQAKIEVERMLVPRSPPPPMSRRPSHRPRIDTRSPACSNVSKTESLPSPGAPLSPRVLAATVASVQRRLSTQKILNTDVEPVEFERRSQRGMSVHESGTGDTARLQQQMVVSSILTNQSWVGILESGSGSNISSAEQWENVRIEVQNWTYDERLDDYMATVSASGLQGRLIDIGSRNNPRQSITTKYFTAQGSVFLRTLQIIIRRSNGEDGEQVFHGNLLGVDSRVPRIIAQTVRGTEIRIELTPAGALSVPVIPSAMQEQRHAADEDRFDVLDSGNKDLTEAEFMKLAAKQIERLVQAEQSEQLPASRVREKRKSGCPEPSLQIPRVGSSRPGSTSLQRQHSWDSVPESDEDNSLDGDRDHTDAEEEDDEDDDEDDDDLALLALMPEDKRKLVRNASNRLLVSPRTQEKRRSRLIQAMGSSETVAASRLQETAAHTRTSQAASAEKTLESERDYAFAMLLEGCQGPHFAWTKFYVLKDAEEYGGSRFTSHLKWEQKGLKTSITRVPGFAKLAAIKMYKYIRVFCGDKVLRPKKKPYREIVGALISRCVAVVYGWEKVVADMCIAFSSALAV